MSSQQQELEGSPCCLHTTLQYSVPHSCLSLPSHLLLTHIKIIILNYSFIPLVSTVFIDTILGGINQENINLDFFQYGISPISSQAPLLLFRTQLLCSLNSLKYSLFFPLTLPVFCPFTSDLFLNLIHFFIFYACGLQWELFCQKPFGPLIPFNWCQTLNLVLSGLLNYLIWNGYRFLCLPLL